MCYRHRDHKTDKNMWFLLFFVLSASALPFPWQEVSNKGTLSLRKGQVYEVDQPIVWSGLENVVVAGNGATIVIHEKIRHEPVFTLREGHTWIWESVNIHGADHGGLFKMHVMKDKAAFFQMRGCYVTSSNTEEIIFDGRSGTIVLENNVFSTRATGTSFFGSMATTTTGKTKIVLTNNQWKGNHILPDLPEATITGERNRWPDTPLPVQWLEAGSFYKPRDGGWCVPPSQHQSINTTYRACLGSWLLEAVKRQTNGSYAPVLYSPVENVIKDESLPATWILQGNHDIDLGGHEWEPETLVLLPNSTTIFRGLEAGWERDRVQVMIMQNATLEFHQLKLRDEEKKIDVSVTTDTSHFFIVQSEVSQANIVATGIGHVHIQDSIMNDFLLSASTLWGSGNLLRSGRIITQPYAGHMQFTQLASTEYHVSPFYLGLEPNYRLRFARNTWTGDSDIVFASGLTKEVSMDQDTITSLRLARKVAFSPHIVTKNIMGGEEAHFISRGLAGSIWPHGATYPIQCPDGTTPGNPDRSGAHTVCIPCENPKLSRDGLCDNVRAMEVALQELEEQPNTKGSLVGLELTTRADTSYLNWYTKEKMREDCYTCAALCLEIPPEEIETYQFTLPELLEAQGSNRTTECSKCALYCADLSGCESLCVPLEYQLLIILAAFIGFGIPLTIGFFIFFKPRRVFMEESSHKKFFNCPLNSNHQVPEGGRFCPDCGADVGSFDPVAQEHQEYRPDKEQ